MSVSNQYDVQFVFTSKVSGAIAQYISNLGVVGTGASNDYILKYFCDEAQLPNVGTMTGQLTGRYTGMGTVAYAHTPVYTEFQLGWMCDANMTPLKFLTAWHNTVIGQGAGVSGSRGENLEEMKNKTSFVPANSLSNRPITISYPDDYGCVILVTKVEQGQTEETRRPSITYYMERAFPVSIDAVPLSYGNSQLTRVTATFQYSRHFTYTNDVTGDTNYLESNVRKTQDDSATIASETERSNDARENLPPDSVTIPTETERSAEYIRDEQTNTSNSGVAGSISNALQNFGVNL
jgi:hypothetical protein